MRGGGPARSSPSGRTMMAAAAAPRLRPLLRALRAQTLRGPLWAHRPPPGPGPAARSLGSASAPALSALPPPPPPPPSSPSPPPPPADPPPAPPPPEAGLEELGLGGLSPAGLVQQLLQGLHLQLGLPWWAAIAAGTVCVRVALLPLLLRAQREAARLALHMPQLQRLSQRLAEARRGDDQMRVAQAYSELVAYQKRHDVNPLRGFLVPLVQTPVFVSFFVALQQLAAAPLPGLRGGGLGWFPDLAAPDPLYLLPLLSAASTWAVLELGAETGVASPGAGPVRQLLRLLPLLFLPFVIHFPAAVFTYWLTSNAFSLAHMGLLRVRPIRALLRLPPPGPAPGEATPPGGAPRKGLLGRLRQEWEEAQATQRAQRRQRQLRQRLEQAARGPLRQTFAHNPLAPPAPAPPAPPKRPWKETLG